MITSIKFKTRVQDFSKWMTYLKIGLILVFHVYSLQANCLKWSLYPLAISLELEISIRFQPWQKWLKKSQQKLLPLMFLYLHSWSSSIWSLVPIPIITWPILRDYPHWLLLHLYQTINWKNLGHQCLQLLQFAYVWTWIPQNCIRIWIK